MIRDRLQGAEQILRAIQRWYFLEAVAGVCLLSAFVGAGPERSGWLLVGVFAGTVAARLRFGDRSGWGRIARAIQVAGGSLAVLLGLAVVAGGVWLMTRGGAGVLVGLVFVPAGGGVTMLAQAMLRVGLTRREDGQDPQPVDLNELISRGTHKRSDTPTGSGTDPLVGSGISRGMPDSQGRPGI